MKKKEVYCDCGKKLSKDEIAICQKLIDEDTDEFYCISCFADYLGVDEDDVKIKISEFKEQGCTLFL